MQGWRGNFLLPQCVNKRLTLKLVIDKVGQQSSFCFKNAHTLKALLFFDSISKEEVRFHAGTVRSWLWICQISDKWGNRLIYCLIEWISEIGRKNDCWYSMAKKGSNCTIVFLLNACSTTVLPSNIFNQSTGGLIRKVCDKERKKTKDCLHARIKFSTSGI